MPKSRKCYKLKENNTNIEKGSIFATETDFQTKISTHEFSGALGSFRVHTIVFVVGCMDFKITSVWQQSPIQFFGYTNTVRRKNKLVKKSFQFKKMNFDSNIHLKSDAKRFFWFTRSLMLVRKLDECMSSSAEKKVSDGFSDVSEMVRWTSRANDSSDLILLSIDWSDVNWSGCACGAECDIISLGIWNSYNF